MSAFDGRPELKSQLLKALGPAPAVTVLNVLQVKPANRESAARTTGSYINNLLPPTKQTDGYTMGIPSSLVRQASDFEKTMLSQSTKLAWTRDFIESIRPGAELDDVSRLLACWKFDQAFPSKSQYLTEEQRESVNLVRQLTEQNSTSVGHWREAVHKTADGILFGEGSDPRSAEGMTEWRMFASATHGSIERMSNAEVKQRINSIAWITAELAYALLDPWWKNDSAAVKNYAQKLLELVRTA
jgi:hypothetical protein